MGSKPKAKEAKIREEAFKYDQAAIDAIKNQYSDLFKQESQLGTDVAQRTTQNLQALQAAATGQAPSVAESQMRAAQDRNLAQQLAAAQAFRGGNPALAQRQLLRNQGLSGIQLTQDAGIARLQEQQANRNMLTQALAQERGLTSQNTQNIAGRQLGIEDALRSAKVQAEQERLASKRQQLGQQAQFDANQAAFERQLIGAGITAGATVLGGPAGGMIASGLVGNGAGSGGGATSVQSQPSRGGQRMENMGFAKGGVVPGTAKESRNSNKNDTVPTMLSPGEVVVPRSAAKSAEGAKKFIDALYAKEQTKKQLEASNPDRKLAQALKKRSRK